jgi:hypothetical protein
MPAPGAGCCVKLCTSGGQGGYTGGWGHSRDTQLESIGRPDSSQLSAAAGNVCPHGGLLDYKSAPYSHPRHVMGHVMSLCMLCVFDMTFWHVTSVGHEPLACVMVSDVS